MSSTVSSTAMITPDPSVACAARVPSNVSGISSSSAARIPRPPHRPAPRAAAGRPGPAGQRQQIPERRAKGDFVDARALDAATEAKELRARGLGRADRGERRAALTNDQRDVVEGLDVVDDGGPCKKPRVHGKWWFVARLAAESLDRVEEGSLLAADIGSPAPPDLEGEAHVVTHDALAQQPTRLRLRDRVLQPLDGQRIFAADVDVPVLAPRRVRGDGHCFDEPERIILHQRPVLECPRLRFIGIADHVVWPHGLSRDGLPLLPRRKRGAAPAQQLRVEDLPDDTGRAELEGAPEPGISVRAAIGVEARGIDHPGPREQTQLRRTSLREPGVRPRSCAIVAAQDGTQLDGRRGAKEGVARALAGHLQERRGRLVAETEARAADPGRRVGIEHDVIAMWAMRERSPHRPLQLGDHLVRAAALACDVIADMEHAARAGRCGQQRVKRRDAVRLGRRHIRDVRRCR